MKEYPKIKAIFDFDEKTHRPIPEIIEYFKPMKDWKWMFTEKIDGTNVRVFWDGHKVYFGGRTDDSQISTKLLTKLQDVFIEELFEQKFGDVPVTLYGEGYGGSIQHGVRDYTDKEDFILFDVNINDIRLERENIEDIAKSFNISCVPIRVYGNLDLGIDRVKENCLGKNKTDKHIEGLVGIPIGGFLDRQGKRIMIKIKAEHFKL